MADMKPFDMATDPAELDRCGHCQENPDNADADLRCVDKAVRHVALYIASQDYVMAVPMCQEHWLYADTTPEVKADIVSSHPFAEACASPYVHWNDETNVCEPTPGDHVHYTGTPPMHTSN